jgi:hypothetical protein
MPHKRKFKQKVAKETKRGPGLGDIAGPLLDVYRGLAGEKDATQKKILNRR